MELDRLHQHVDELFLHHQVYLMRDDIENAMRLFERIYEYTNQNIKDEEEFLIPFYAAHPAIIKPGGAVYFFEREHKLLRREMRKYLKLYGEYLLEPGSVEIDLVKIFDEYYTLKDLFDHHDARERVFLFAALDKIMPDSQKSDILSRIAKRQQDLLKKMDDE
jgi:hypothetical protein